MSVDIKGNVNDIRISCIHSDHKLGSWWSFATSKGWLEIRTTKTGLIKIIGNNKGQHPYFTPNLFNIYHNKKGDSDDIQN